MKTESNAPKNPIACLAWFTFCYAIAFVGYEGCAQGLWFWYITLNLPKWDPPVWTVTPVCTVLYGLGAYASWLVWRGERSGSRTAGLIFFFLQLALSGLWPWLLYSGHLLLWSGVDLVALWVVQLITTIAFARVRPKAAWLMAPSLICVAFVVVLNFVVWQLNR